MKSIIALVVLFIASISIAYAGAEFSIGDTVTVIFVPEHAQNLNSVIAKSKGIIIGKDLGWTSGPSMIATGLYRLKIPAFKRVFTTSPSQFYDMIGYGSYTMPEKGIVVIKHSPSRPGYSWSTEGTRTTHYTSSK